MFPYDKDNKITVNNKEVVRKVIGCILLLFTIKFCSAFDSRSSKKLCNSPRLVLIGSI